MSIAKGLARAAKAAKRHNKNKARQGNDLVGNRGEDGSLMTDKDWSNKMREEKQLDDMPTMPSDVETLLQQLDNNNLDLWQLSGVELMGLHKKLVARLKEMDDMIGDEIEYMDRQLRRGATRKEVGLGGDSGYHRMLNDKDTIKTHLLEIEEVLGEKQGLGEKETAYGKSMEEEEFDWDDPYIHRDFYLK